ncbi:MAG TPA: HoxN/HupN/NixA family nickel/cobalt transporter [Usitatibacter sp.]|nr:HoxN/HupN/NixA family nickel/cobalt transporter [Usitatibacter sp.]
MREIVHVLREVFADHGGDSRRRVIALYAVLLALNVGAWIWALVAFAGNAVLLGAAFLAYTFGLRHAFDADHIASIDSVTRKLMQRNARPMTVGLHFALGHSLALFAFVAAIAAFRQWGPQSGGFGVIAGSAGLASTFVSVTFLLVMAALNLSIASSTYRTFRRVRAGGTYVEEDFDVLLNKRGIFSRIFRPLFRLVNKAWHMIFLGLLFGLGFDTATEVSLLGMAGAEAARGLSVWLILAFPALFAAGMALMDTTDSVLMVRAYGWALRNPIRKLYYNMTITVVSAVVALAVAGIEALAFMSEQFSIQGEFWSWVNAINEHWEAMGVFVLTLFLSIWLASMLVYRARRYQEAELAVVPVGKTDD